jgi:hypothetical protein
MAKESARSLAAQRIGAVMLRTTNPQPSLWEAILPDACLGLPAELARVDRLLDAPAFLARWPATSTRIGRPSVPLDTCLRMMFLKFRYRLAMSWSAARSPTRSPGSGFAGSRWVGRSPIRPRWSSSPAAWASRP